MPLPWLIPHGSLLIEPLWVSGLTFSEPFRMSLMRQKATSNAVRGTLKSSTGTEYLFHTVTWMMRPVLDTLVTETSVSIWFGRSGRFEVTLVAPLRDTRK